MIPSALLRVRVRAAALEPRFVDPTEEAQLARAGRALEIVRGGVARGARYGEVADELDEVAVTEPDPKLWRGLCHTALARTESDDALDLDPATVRAAVFARAAARGPLRLGGAAEVLAAHAAETGTPVEVLREALYADLPTERSLAGVDIPSAAWLLHRYNVGLAQAVLRDATELTIHLENPTAPRMRQLFRHIAFHQLLHRARRVGEDVEIVLDGPLSLFSASTRYGRALASFLPALLLHDRPWTLRATVLWTRARHRKALVLSHATGLLSHYPDTGAWRSRAVEQFERRFAEEGAPWALRDGELPLDLGRGAVVWPDFTARAGDRVAHLQILGHWKEEPLREHLARLDSGGPPNLLVLASRKLRGDRAGALEDHPRLLWFADVIPPASVRKRLEALVPP